MEEAFKQTLSDFKKNHFLNADFRYWDQKIISLFKKFQRLKSKEKQNIVLLELYVSYIQILEILFINIFALSNKIENFPASLFIDNNNLRTFIKDAFLQETSLSKWFIDKCIFQLHIKDEAYAIRHKLYSNMLMECAHDYLEDYELLNAYKHGYRIFAKHDKLAVSLIKKDGEQMLLDQSDSKIIYYAKEKNKEKQTINIVEKNINFKNNRVFGKTLYICTLLNNLKITVLYSFGIKPKVKIPIFDVDEQEWIKTFGGSKFSKPIFSIVKDKK